jgi:AraC-like DNA-binding protein
MHSRRPIETYRLINRDIILLMFDPRQLPNIAHIGKSHYQYAKGPLSDHIHAGTMEICYLEAGEQVFFVGGRRYHLKGGEVFVTYPDELHSTDFQPMEKSMLYWVGIDLATPARHFLGYHEPEAELLRRKLLRLRPRMFKGSALLREKFERALDAYDNTSELWFVLFRGYITELLEEVCACARRKRVRPLSPAIRNVLHHIDRTVETKIPISELAAITQLSITRFKLRFRTETGITPHEYILRKKIERATALLKHGRMSITTVANALGFSSGQYFATVFRRFTRKAPRDNKL